jgi:hypothetical protein
MTAANTAPALTEASLRLIHDDVRAGHAGIATFGGPRGLCWVEILGPRGMRPDGRLLVAPVPTLRLCVPDQGPDPLAVAANDTDFDGGLHGLEKRALPHLHAYGAESLRAVLCVVRQATKARGPNVPSVELRVIEAVGEPSLTAWASCLTLADLEAAVLDAVA